MKRRELLTTVIAICLKSLISRFKSSKDNETVAIRNQNALSTLDSLHCSIVGTGRIKRGKVGGREIDIVEEITSIKGVVWRDVPTVDETDDE